MPIVVFHYPTLTASQDPPPQDFEITLKIGGE